QNQAEGSDERALQKVEQSGARVESVYDESEARDRPVTVVGAESQASDEAAEQGARERAWFETDPQGKEREGQGSVIGKKMAGIVEERDGSGHEESGGEGFILGRANAASDEIDEKDGGDGEEAGAERHDPEIGNNGFCVERNAPQPHISGLDESERDGEDCV